MTDTPIQLMLSDVDGTLVDSDKRLTPATVDAVRRLREAGVVFAVTSGRPPRGMSMLVEPLGLTTPLSGFNGGMIVDPTMHPIEELSLPGDLVGPIIESLRASSMSVWAFQGSRWLVPALDAPHVAKEVRAVQYDPEVVPDLDGLVADAASGSASVTKLVGVSDDHDAVQCAEAELRDRFGDRVAASRSQTYYLDVTNPDANKGSVARYLATQLGIPTEAVATIGDMPNDVLMFAQSGLSIAMGNAAPDVQRTARRVTSTNDEDGFARAVDEFVLPTLPQHPG